MISQKPYTIYLITGEYMSKSGASNLSACQKSEGTVKIWAMLL